MRKNKLRILRKFGFATVENGPMFYAFKESMTGVQKRGKWHQ